MIAATIVLVFVGLLVVYRLLFPEGRFIFFSGPKGSQLVFSRDGLEIVPPPDQIPENGLDHLRPYLQRLVKPGNQYKSLIISSTDGERGPILLTRDGQVEVSLSASVPEEAGMEQAIRAFFSSRGIDPSEDYLAGGEVPDSIRCLSYPVPRELEELEALVRKVCIELCDIQPHEALELRYRDRG